MSYRHQFDLSAAVLQGINPVGDEAAAVWIERDPLRAIEFTVTKEGAYNARRLASLLMIASESVDPRGYRLLLPEEDLEPVVLEAETLSLETKR